VNEVCIRFCSFLLWLHYTLFLAYCQAFFTNFIPFLEFLFRLRAVASRFCSSFAENFKKLSKKLFSPLDKKEKLYYNRSILLKSADGNPGCCRKHFRESSDGARRYAGGSYLLPELPSERRSSPLERFLVDLDGLSRYREILLLDRTQVGATHQAEWYRGESSSSLLRNRGIFA